MNDTVVDTSQSTAAEGAVATAGIVDASKAIAVAAAVEPSASVEAPNLQKFHNSLRRIADFFVTFFSERSGYSANTEFWDADNAGIYSVREDVLPSGAIEDVAWRNLDKYKLECSTFVLFIQLLAIIDLIGEKKFDDKISKAGGKISWFPPSRRIPFLKETYPSNDREIPIGADVTLSAKCEVLLHNTNGSAQDFCLLIQPSWWRNEHVLKIGDDRYVALGLNRPPQETKGLSWSEITRRYAAELRKYLGADYEEFHDSEGAEMGDEEKEQYIQENLVYVSSVYEVRFDVE